VRGIAVLLTCGLLAATPGSADDHGLVSRYREIASFFRDGDVEAAAHGLDELTPAGVARAVTLIRTSIEDPRVDLVYDWNAPLLSAALVMHLHLYVDGAKVGRPMSWHIGCARELLIAYRIADGDEMVRNRSAAVIAWLLQIEGRLELLRVHLDGAILQSPHDLALLIARGVLAEAGASPRYGDAGGGARQDLEAAERAYRAALSADENAAEARVRLGYVLLRLTRLHEARSELSRATAQPTAVRLLYLAWLFLGATHEATGDISAAASAYGRAKAAAPDCQVAAIALANAQRQLGSATLAAETARRAALGSATDCEDPWWSYDYGQAWQLDETLQLLRRRVQR
jgi:tetratricopeptide (TPR) repeat protein